MYRSEYLYFKRLSQEKCYISRSLWNEIYSRDTDQSGYAFDDHIAEEDRQYHCRRHNTPECQEAEYEAVDWYA